MHRTLLSAMVVLLAAASLRAEYSPGFNLYSHSADADLIVLAEVDTRGSVRVLEVLKGKSQPGASLEVDREVLLRTRKKLFGPPNRAFLFLSGGRLDLDGAGIGWIERGKVFLLPDNWGYGICYPLEYREPTPEEFRKSVAVALADVREVARIAKLPRGPDRVAAASALLLRTRKELDWYVAEAHSWMDQMHMWRGEGYIEEIAVGLWRSHVPFHQKEPASDLERAAWREIIAELPPGPVRRAHLWILSWASLRPDDCPLLEKCLASATESREREAAGSALLKADPGRALALFTEKIDVANPSNADTLLRLLLAAAAGEKLQYPPVVALAADLVPAFLRIPKSTDATNLGSAIVGALGKTERVEDLRLLLALARSDRGGAGQALVELRRLAQKGWSAADGRWDDYLSTLTGLPSGK